MTMTDQEIDTLRSMTPADKLAVMHALIRQAYELKAAALRAQRPELSEEELGRWAEELSLQELVEQARGFSPPE